MSTDLAVVEANIVGHSAVDQGEVHTSIEHGVSIKLIKLRKGQLVHQHVHDYGHPTIVGYGVVRVWRSGLFVKDATRGQVISIAAHEEHAFLALEDADLYCVHNEDRALAAGH